MPENDLLMDKRTPLQLREVFLREARKKLDILEALLESDTLESSREDIFMLTHGLKGYAGYVGLHRAADAAGQTCAALQRDAPGHILKTSVTGLAELLQKILEVNAHEIENGKK